MYTKEQLKTQLENMGLTGEETILIHSSMKSIGEVEGGADTVLDAWIEYLEEFESPTSRFVAECSIQIGRASCRERV